MRKYFTARHERAYSTSAVMVIKTLTDNLTNSYLTGFLCWPHLTIVYNFKSDKFNSGRQNFDAEPVHM